ncbi:MAG TPA: hypothetical protein VH092_17865 [Urbifossiella sp.]|nr:hypothetical protein [Urbifossiella sp.]
MLVQIVNGQLFVKGPKKAREIGRHVLARKDEVFAYLVATAPWSLMVAIRRIEAADAAVERYSCRGAHPKVQLVVAGVCRAFEARHLPALDEACSVLETVVKELHVGDN